MPRPPSVHALPPSPTTIRPAPRAPPRRSAGPLPCCARRAPSARSAGRRAAPGRRPARTRCRRSPTRRRTPTRRDVLGPAGRRRAACRSPPSRPASTSTKPGPPSDCGASVSRRRGGRGRQPSAIACGRLDRGQAVAVTVRRDQHPQGATGTPPSSQKIRRALRQVHAGRPTTRSNLAGVKLLGRKKDDGDNPDDDPARRLRRRSRTGDRHASHHRTQGQAHPETHGPTAARTGRTRTDDLGRGQGAPQGARAARS